MMMMMVAACHCTADERDTSLSFLTLFAIPKSSNICWLNANNIIDKAIQIHHQRAFPIRSSCK